MCVCVHVQFDISCVVMSCVVVLHAWITAVQGDMLKMLKGGAVAVASAAVLFEALILKSAWTFAVVLGVAVCFWSGTIWSMQADVKETKDVFSNFTRAVTDLKFVQPETQIRFCSREV